MYQRRLRFGKPEQGLWAWRLLAVGLMMLLAWRASIWFWWVFTPATPTAPLVMDQDGKALAAAIAAAAPFGASQTTAASLVDWHLVALMVGQRGYAVLERDSPQTLSASGSAQSVLGKDHSRVVRVGDELDGGWTVKDLRSEELVLTSGAATQTLRLQRGNGKPADSVSAPAYVPSDAEPLSAIPPRENQIPGWTAPLPGRRPTR